MFFKKTKNIYVIFLLIFAVSQLYASSRAEKLIMAHINASGGKNAFLQMQTISRYGNITFYSPNNLSENYCYHTDIIYPTKLREQIKSNQILIDRGTNSISYWAWINNQYQFLDDKDQDLRDYLRKTAERANRDMLWVLKESDSYDIMSSLPIWAPSNTQCIQKIASGLNQIYCFDNHSGLLVALGNNEEYRIESDWRQVGNIKLPFRLTHYQQGKIAYEVQLHHAELNKPISNSQFTKPTISQLSCE